MILVLDGKTISVNLNGETTLAEFLQYVVAMPECRQRVIDCVILNGSVVESWDESPIPVGPNSEVHVSTRPLTRVLVETVASCREYLPRLIEGCVTAATFFHQGREGDAFAMMQDIIGGIQWYNEFLSHVLSLARKEYQELQRRLAALRQVLTQLMVSLEQRDVTLSADVLEYELVPELEAGLQLVDLLAAEFAAGLGNGK